MEDSKSNTSDDEDRFFDAADEFPFYDCVDTDESDQPISHASSISQLVPIEPIKSPSEIVSPTGLRRRRSFSQHIRKDISGNDSKRSNPDPSVSSETNQTHDAITTTTTPRERKYRFSRNLKESEGEGEKSESFKVRFSSGRASDSINEENKENSTITAANGERIDESVAVDSRPGEIDESSNFLFLLAKLLIKAIGFQISLLVSFFTFPIWILYCSYMFVIDPFRAVRRGREYLTGKLLRVWGVVCENVTPFVYEWLKEHKSTWMLALRFGWGLLWSAYVCFILVSLLVLAFVVSGIMMRFLVEEPIRIKETLNFDYTKNSPVALVPIISCLDASSSEYHKEKNEVERIGGPRVVHANHKLQATVSLTLPESDYNRNLGIFQVKVDFLSANGKALASSRRPCMLQFKSQPIRLLLTFLKVAPLVAGYVSESQTLDIKFSGFIEREIPTACLQVVIEQRAEYRPGAGIPEIYAASLILESELPLLKRILWYWKKTIFIWISMMIFTMELFFTLLCCKPIIIPRVRLRDGSANNSAPQNNHPVQR
ncbi:seipin-2 [Cornus florida]|uniref:seipin-2 n=1 Tax=Cornus florida TaxID=4283 RepID=UPI0028A05F72|nr:seipin-2 [Cornus florida]